MAKKIGQVRYYGMQPNANLPQKKNYPINATYTKMRGGNNYDIFPRGIVQLGIQAMPGTKFSLNHGITPIVVGSTGVYELNVDGLAYINHIAFDKAGLEIVDKNPNAFILVDFIYEEGQ